MRWLMLAPTAVAVAPIVWKGLTRVPVPPSAALSSTNQITGPVKEMVMLA